MLTSPTAPEQTPAAPTSAPDDRPAGLPVPLPENRLKLFLRALALRCPACGSGGLFASWFSIRPACPCCGVWFEREEGYFLGAMALNLIVAELLPAAVGVAWIVSTWPNPPWTVLQFVAPLAMGLSPLLFYPWSRTLWLTLDWTFHPPVYGQHGHDHPRPGLGPAPRSTRK